MVKDLFFIFIYSCFYKHLHIYTVVELDRDGPFGKEAQQWIKADYDSDGKLSRQEFISFSSS